MGEQDRLLSVQDLLHLASGRHGTGADVNPVLLLVGGKHVVAPTAIDNGDHVITWLDAEGYQTPHRETILLDSYTTLGTNQNGSAFAGLGAFKDAEILVHVTAAAGTSPTLDVFLDTRLDGTNWVNLAHVTQITGTTTRVAHITKRNPALDLVVASDAGAGTVRAIGWADDLRVRSEIAGTGPSFTSRIWADLSG